MGVEVVVEVLVGRRGFGSIDVLRYLSPRVWALVAYKVRYPRYCRRDE
jgi:hypothetical protein